MRLHHVNLPERSTADAAYLRSKVVSGELIPGGMWFRIGTVSIRCADYADAERLARAILGAIPSAEMLAADERVEREALEGHEASGSATSAAPALVAPSIEARS